MLTKIELAQEVCARLEKIYPEAQCALESEGEAWKLLIMGRLSAQCTDARVNIVCRELFAVYPSAEAIANAELESLEAIVRPCGLYKAKAKNIRDACKMLVENYNGVLPDTMEQLLTFPGVGRKIANLLLGDIYHKPAIVTDTHCMRICGRLGFYPETLKSPEQIERILTPIVEPEKSADFCHRLVSFGRDTCTARSPTCGNCQMSDICRHNAEAD